MITEGSNVLEMVKEFFCSGEIWHEVADKVDTSAIWFALEEDLKMIDYSPIVKEYATFYVCRLPNSPFLRPEDGWYSRKKQIVYQSFNLDYLQVEAVSQEELLAIMAQKYLDGIPKIKTFWGMKSTPFDTDKFYLDAKNLFEKKGFL